MIRRCYNKFGLHVFEGETLNEHLMLRHMNLSLLERQCVAAVKFKDEIKCILEKCKDLKNEKNVSLGSSYMIEIEPAMKLLHDHFDNLCIVLNVVESHLKEYDGCESIEAPEYIECLADAFELKNDEYVAKKAVMQLYIDTEVNLTKIEIALYHEFNHLYEKLQRFRNRPGNDNALLDIDSRIDYMHVMNCRDHAENQDIFTLFDSVYKMWITTERNAYIAETYAQLENFDKSHGYEIELIDIKNNAPSIFPIMKDLIMFEFFFLPQGNFKYVSDICINALKRCFINEKISEMPNEAFRQYIARSSLKLVKKIEQKVSKVVGMYFADKNEKMPDRKTRTKCVSSI